MRNYYLLCLQHPVSISNEIASRVSPIGRDGEFGAMFGEGATKMPSQYIGWTAGDPRKQATQDARRLGVIPTVKTADKQCDCLPEMQEFCERCIELAEVLIRF